MSSSLQKNNSLTMLPNVELGKKAYLSLIQYGQCETKNVVKKLKWQDVLFVMKDGKYYTLTVLADALNCDKDIIARILSANKENVYSPNHLSPKTHEKYYVLKDSRDFMYEAVRPLQLAIRSLF